MNVSDTKNSEQNSDVGKTVIPTFLSQVNAIPTGEAADSETMIMSRRISGSLSGDDWKRKKIPLAKVTVLPSYLNVDLHVTAQYTPDSLLSLARMIVGYDALDDIRGVGFNTKLISDLAASIFPSKSTLIQADTKTVSHILTAQSCRAILVNKVSTDKLDVVATYVCEIFSRQLKTMGVLYKHEEWVDVKYRAELIPCSETLIREAKIAAVYDILMKLDSYEATSELVGSDTSSPKDKLKFGAMNLAGAVTPIFQQISRALKNVEKFGAYCETAFAIGRKFFSEEADTFKLLPSTVTNSQVLEDLLSDYTFIRCLTESRDFQPAFPAMDYLFALQKLHDALYMRKTFASIPLAEFREYGTTLVAKDGYDKPEVVVSTLNVKSSGKMSLVKFFPVVSNTEGGGQNDMLTQVQYGAYSERASAFSVPIFDKLNTSSAASHIRMLLEYRDIETLMPHEDPLYADSVFLQGIILDEASLGALATATPGVELFLTTSDDELTYTLEFQTVNQAGRYVSTAMQEGRLIITSDPAEVLLVNNDYIGSKFFVASDRLVEGMDKKIIISPKDEISTPLQVRKLRFDLDEGINLGHAIGTTEDTIREPRIVTNITLQKLLGIPDGLALDVIYMPAAAAILSRSISAILNAFASLPTRNEDMKLIQKALGMVLYQIFSPAIESPSTKDAVRALQIAMLEDQQERRGKEILRSKLKIRKHQVMMKMWVTLTVLQRVGLLSWKQRNTLANYFAQVSVYDDVALSSGLI